MGQIRGKEEEVAEEERKMEGKGGGATGEERRGREPGQMYHFTHHRPERLHLLLSSCPSFSLLCSHSPTQSDLDHITHNRTDRGSRERDKRKKVRKGSRSRGKACGKQDKERDHTWRTEGRREGRGRETRRARAGKGTGPPVHLWP